MKRRRCASPRDLAKRNRWPWRLVLTRAQLSSVPWPPNAIALVFVGQHDGDDPFGQRRIGWVWRMGL